MEKRVNVAIDSPVEVMSCRMLMRFFCMVEECTNSSITVNEYLNSVSL